MDWKNNEKVRFAVGVTATFLLIRWLVTGDLLFAVSTAVSPPQEGEQPASILSTVWPMFFEAMVVVGTSAIGWAFKLWDVLYALVVAATAAAKPAASTDATASSSEVDVPTSTEGLVQGLARAAATNDEQSLAKLKVQIRKPYALDELSQAYQDGDMESARKLTAELDAMMAARNGGAS